MSIYTPQFYADGRPMALSSAAVVLGELARYHQWKTVVDRFPMDVIHPDRVTSGWYKR